jgi:malonyl CoA-acyl carrier protein transacylase
MTDRAERAVAIVGVGAILPDAPNARAFRDNVWAGRYSIIEVPPGRWSVADYYDPDPAAPAKTYSKIGSWVRGFQFDWKRWHIPPRVAAAMDEGQQWAVTIAAEALADYGWPDRGIDSVRTAVVLGNAMAGERHYLTTLRISFPEYERLLLEAEEFLDLPAEVRSAILARWREVVTRKLPEITEDTMPGELSNILSGRVANVLNLRGPNFTTDAACASTFAALDAAVDMLLSGHCDAVLTGGVDRNMGVNSFVKFSKIGALSARGTRPFGDGADGFVMGEGSAAFLLKRLADAERDGDRVYAVVRGVGGSSDGKGKGITAPNPIGQRLAVERAWENAGLDPATAGLVEAHGTSTKVGDVVEVESLSVVFKSAARSSIALGSAKSNIGHLKAGAGAAGLLKAVWAVHEKMLPPTLNAKPPNPGIDFASTPFVLNHELREWKPRNGIPRRCGVSAYGFGGTNFHVVLEEHVPGALTRGRRPAQVSVPAAPEGGGEGGPLAAEGASSRSSRRPPLRGLAVVGATSVEELRAKVAALLARVEGGSVPPVTPPDPADLSAPERLAIDYGDGRELKDRLQKARKGLTTDAPATWKAFQAQGVFRGSGPAAGKIAFLFTGQGSQYVNMGRDLAAASPLVASVFEEADRVLEPILGRPLTSYVFVDHQDPEAVRRAEEDLKQTAITQPAVLTVDTAISRLLGEYGLEPDMVMGHSLGEYGALVSAEVLTFAEALEAAAARGREMSRVSFDDNGAMAAVMGPADTVLEVLAGIEGYVVPANLNARGQVVVGGETAAVERAIRAFEGKGFPAQRLQVSHAFHTKIVAPAATPLRRVLERFDVRAPKRPLVSNVTADLYPSDPEAIRDVLCRQIASPVRWVEGVERLYAAGVRAFVEVGPKRALKGFVDDVLAGRPDVTSLFTNRPRPREAASFNQALAGLYAAGYGVEPPRDASVSTALGVASEPPSPSVASAAPAVSSTRASTLDELRALLTRTLESLPAASRPSGPFDRNQPPEGSVVISGTGLGLPGSAKSVMDSRNAERILAGEQFVDAIPDAQRRTMAAMRVTRVVKSEDGSGHFETIDDPAEVIKLAGRAGPFDLAAEYGVPEKLVDSLDVTTQLAMAAGLDALREAGIPLVQTYRRTTTGKYLPDRWMLPEPLRDETGVIFASAFPGYDRFANENRRYYADQGRRAQRSLLLDLRARTRDAETLAEIDRRISELDALLEKEPYAFDRRFLFRILTMGHSQFAEYIGARGPNTHVNAACASSVQGLALAEDWIRAGRCRRVLVIGGDDVTSPNLLEWMGAGFLASGAAATDERVEDAALPFDRRRHGMLLGMGACALVVESQDAVEERGMRGIVELLASETRNSAFHATRLDVSHIADVVESLVASTERRFGLDRRAMAPRTVFVSHETFTPARGGSAAAEVRALRDVFGADADRIVVSNTKGFTGHAMGVGIEDVIAVKILEHGIVPPVPNFREPDPELGALTLSKGGRYPVEYAIHLGAGFGSQIALSLTRRIPGALDRVDDRPGYEGWLAAVSGYGKAETEVVKRVLRVVAPGVPERAPAGTSWRFGLGPTKRTPAASTGVSPAVVRGVHAAPALPQAPSGPAAPVPVAASARVATTTTAPTATVPTPAPTTSSAAGTSAPPSAPEPDAVVTRVLALVADKTGYPPDMLDLDLDLEADLGVDTVKQAETFAAVREAYGIPRQESLKLRDFPTLQHVVQFVYDFRPDLKPAAGAAAGSPLTGVPPAPSPAAPAPVAAPALGAPPTSARDHGPAPAGPGGVEGPARPGGVPGADGVVQKVLAIVAEKTGYPEDMLDLDLDLEADLGVDTVKQAETFAAVREAYGIPRQESLKLRDFPTLQHVVQFVYDFRPELKPAAPAVGSPPAGEQAAPSPATSAPIAAPAGPGGVEGPARPGGVPGADGVVQKVLAIVADKTGYPEDMLDLDLDLEADLGVDTVKQAETFAAVREAYGIPRQESLKLRDFPTLQHVVQFVYDFRPDLKPAAPAAPPPERPIAGTPASTEADRPAAGATATLAAEESAPTPPAPRLAPLEEADRMPRRVTVPSLRPPLDLCKPTGVSLDGASRIVAVLDEGGTGLALARALEESGARVLAIEAQASAEDVQRHLRRFLDGGPVQGVYWLAALDVEPDLDEMDLAAFREQNRRRVKNLHVAMRALFESVSAPGTFLVAGTRMGGLHGHTPEGATAPLGGAVAGFTKAYKRERPEVLVKVVDFAPDAPADEVAAALMAETLGDPGVVEVGYHDGLRWTVALEERPAADGGRGLALGADTVFVVTGAAGGITSAIVADLAAASGGHFVLIDLVPEPSHDDPQIALVRRDREGLKRTLIEEARARGEKPTPVAIDRRIMAVERAEAALRAIEAVESAGGRALWRSANLLDGGALAAIVEEVRQAFGRIDVLVHAGGIEISRGLAEKEPAEFDRVFDIKADGFFSLLRAAEGLPIGATVVFSSIAGRFGNAGQTDYSAANALLCSLSRALRRTRPETRSLAIDWTAWGGIGMATRGSIPQIMAAAGISMLPPEAGIPTVRRELVAGGFSGEVVVAGELGVMGAELDETGGLDVEKLRAALARRRRPLVMVGDVAAARLHGGLEVRTTLDPRTQPFLFDHRIDETPVLPGVMGTEAFVEVASVLCPGFRLAAVEEVSFLLPFKFFRSRPATLHLSAVASPAAVGEVVVEAALRSVVQPKPELPPQVRVHFRARVRMRRAAPQKPRTAFRKPAPRTLDLGREAIYQVYFHGPAYRVIEKAAVGDASVVALMARDLPSNASPGDAEALAAPRLLELLFQAAGLWLLVRKETMALPTALERAWVYRRPEEAKRKGLYAVVTVREEGAAFDGRVVDEKGLVYAEVVGYRTVALPERRTLEPVASPAPLILEE